MHLNAGISLWYNYFVLLALPKTLLVVFAVEKPVGNENDGCVAGAAVRGVENRDAVVGVGWVSGTVVAGWTGGTVVVGGVSESAGAGRVDELVVLGTDK